MNSEAREDYQRQLDDERRMVEEESRRYLEAHPGYERCPRHPERDVVDSSVATYRYCAECVETHREAYADAKRDSWPDDGISAWIHGAGDRPSSYFEKEPK